MTLQSFYEIPTFVSLAKKPRDRYLMNPATGSVDTYEEWLAEMPGWSDDPDECQRQFDELVEITPEEATECADLHTGEHHE